MKTITFNPIKTISLVFMSIALLAGSCKKAEKGDTGPQGPAGPAGVNGNANVITYSVNAASGDWVLSGNTYYIDVSIAGITQDIQSSGAVQVFMESTTQTGTWLNMPWIDYGSGYFSTYNYVYNVGMVRISKSDNDLTTPSNPGVRRFKVVIIASSGLIANPNLDLTNYEEIKKTFELKD